jgi:hypothetical protein
VHIPHFGIDQAPALVGLVPDFGDDVVDKPARHEVAGESHPRSRRNARVAQHGHVEQREIAATAHKAIGRRALWRER